MALPTSGQISFNDLRTELGIPSQSPFSLTTAAEGGYVTINTSSPSRPSASKPHKISDWYGYNHTYSANRILKLDFTNRIGNGTASALKNGSIVLSLTTAATIQTSINPGDTFSGRIVVTSTYRGDLEVVSTTRGGLFVSYGLSGTTNSGTYTLQSGEDITVYGYSYKSCLIAGTRVTLPNGEKVAIETLKAGDTLKSIQINTLEDTNDLDKLTLWDNDTLIENITQSKISEISKEEVPYVITFNEGMLTGSSRHLHLVNREGKWKFIRFAEVKVGDFFRNENNQNVLIEKIDYILSPTPVYRIVLEVPSHTFYANGLLTHNIK